MFIAVFGRQLPLPELPVAMIPELVTDTAPPEEPEVLPLELPRITPDVTEEPLNTALLAAASKPPAAPLSATMPYAELPFVVMLPELVTLTLAVLLLELPLYVLPR